MHVTSLAIKHFRCFENFSIALDNPMVVITGRNGSGKSSLIEALHYGCYLRSFRTHLARDMIGFGKEALVVQVRLWDVEIGQQHTLHVGFSGAKRIIKLDEAPVESYKDIIHHYRTVTLSADDLMLIQGEPGLRRMFLDQALSIYKPETVQIIRTFRHLLEQRNAFLAQGRLDQQMYTIWTEQFWQASKRVQQERIFLIGALQKKINMLVDDWFEKTVFIELKYSPKKGATDLSYEQFFDRDLMVQEQALGRSCFGAHLDDLVIHFGDKKSRQFASRGQQKLIIMLLKIAYMQLLLDRSGKAVFLLDDFLTDLDKDRTRKLIALIQNLGCQLIITATELSPLKSLIEDQGGLHIALP